VLVVLKMSSFLYRYYITIVIIYYNVSSEKLSNAVCVFLKNV